MQARPNQKLACSLFGHGWSVRGGGRGLGQRFGNCKSFRVVMFGVGMGKNVKQASLFRNLVEDKRQPLRIESRYVPVDTR